MQPYKKLDEKEEGAEESRVKQKTCARTLLNSICLPILIAVSVIAVISLIRLILYGLTLLDWEYVVMLVVSIIKSGW